MTSLTEFFNKHEDDALKGISHKNSIIKRNIIAYMAVNGECTLSDEKIGYALRDLKLNCVQLPGFGEKWRNTFIAYSSSEEGGKSAGYSSSNPRAAIRWAASSGVVCQRWARAQIFAYNSPSTSRSMVIRLLSEV